MEKDASSPVLRVVWAKSRCDMITVILICEMKFLLDELNGAVAFGANDSTCKISHGPSKEEHIIDAMAGGFILGKTAYFLFVFPIFTFG